MFLKLSFSSIFVKFPAIFRYYINIIMKDTNYNEHRNDGKACRSHFGPLIISIENGTS